VSLTLPLVHGLEAGDDEEAKRVELRELAKRPSTPRNWDELLAFPAAFEKFFDDHFGYRREMVGAFMRLKGAWLGVSPSPLVALGTNGWLYFTKDKLFNDYRGEQRLGEQALRGWQLALEDRRRWLAEHGALYMSSSRPTKSRFIPNICRRACASTAKSCTASTRSAATSRTAPTSASSISGPICARWHAASRST
jgi:hypothetical protein